ncbi:MULTISPECIES: helix-turn-helix domain-containing protein [Haloferacaceae]|uniref:Helix-turn-helix domain-containing protein n=1 Tax=Halorubrum glutamatedens TaxID=2707018 RepID=A0ABD5QUY1_9EURY|nr:helix-turn-helix domain-containing protein [Halobellus captivus]
MREFTFSIDYEAGVDPMTDVFIDHPSLVARGLHGCVNDDDFWRIERFSGPMAALDAVERLRLDGDVRTESVTETDFLATEHHEILERSDGERVVYTYVERVGGGRSVQTLAGRYLPRGSLLCSRRSEDRHEWRILMRSDEKVGLLYDALGANLRSGLSFHMGHLRDARRWGHDSLGTVSLDPEQRTALRAAARNGYYRSPSEITLEELASKLNVPRSTLSYRLRRAEEQLVMEYVNDV